MVAAALFLAGAAAVIAYRMTGLGVDKAGDAPGREFAGQFDSGYASHATLRFRAYIGPHAAGDTAPLLILPTLTETPATPEIPDRWRRLANERRLAIAMPVFRSVNARLWDDYLDGDTDWMNRIADRLVSELARHPEIDVHRVGVAGVEMTADIALRLGVAIDGARVAVVAPTIGPPPRLPTKRDARYLVFAREAEAARVTAASDIYHALGHAAEIRIRPESQPIDAAALERIGLAFVLGDDPESGRFAIGPDEDAAAR
ncbi:hypothetical protein K8I61_09805 [bacterium]|nr:hypothetical protein [bacterium]